MRPWWTTKGTRQWKWQPGQWFSLQKWEQFIIIDGLRLCLWAPSVSHVILDLDPDCEENSWNHGFSFCLLTEGSGSGRPKNTWIQIRICKTDSNLFSLVKFNHRYFYFSLPPHKTSVFVNMFTVFLFQERATGSPLSRCPAPIHLPAQRTQRVTAVRGGGGGGSAD